MGKNGQLIAQYIFNGDPGILTDKEIAEVTEWEKSLYRKGYTSLMIEQVLEGVGQPHIDNDGCMWYDEYKLLGFSI